MKMFMKQLFLMICIVLIGLFMFSCGSRQVPDGGPCEYEVTTYPAIILGLDSINQESCDLILKVNPYGASDTLSYYLEEHSYVTYSELNKLNLKVGDTLKYVERNLKTGACNPHIVNLIIERYE